MCMLLAQMLVGSVYVLAFGQREQQNQNSKVKDKSKLCDLKALRRADKG